MPEIALLAQIRAQALQWLARREYAVLELQQRLLHKGFDAEAVEQAVIQLQADRLLSNERFAESFVYARVQRGYGPLRIAYELKQHGIEAELFESVEHWQAADWWALARSARARRFGLTPIADDKTKLKQMRFLQQRGFSHEQIKEALAATEEDT